MAHEWRRADGFTVSDDPARMDVDLTHAFLTQYDWARGIPRATVERSIAHSLSFGVYAPIVGDEERQVGFARVITDRATFAYLADVFVIEAYRGRGLAKLLLSSIAAHPELQGLRSWLLFTEDAHGLYEQFGFARTTVPERVMQWRPGVTYGTDAKSTNKEGENEHTNR